MTTRSMFVLATMLILLSGCVSKIDTGPHRQFLSDSLLLDGLLIKYGQDTNDTWNAYVAGQLSDQQTIDFLNQVNAMDRREMTAINAIGHDTPTSIPNSNYDKIITDLRIGANTINSMCNELLTYFSDKDTTHADTAQKYMIRLEIYVKRVNNDVSQEIAALNAYEAK